jgi:ribosomal protein S18 acetylase RimI-like enzyme
MTVTFRPYKPATDFDRVRNFLSETCQAFGRPLNWRIERWNWARYHPSMFAGDARRNIALWESAVGIWEYAVREIVGVVHVEAPRYGEAYFQRHPAHDSLLPKMVDYAEARLVDTVQSQLRIHAFDHDEPLKAVLRTRGYQQASGQPEYDSELVIGEAPIVRLPPGYTVRSMAEGGDPVRRCKVQGLGFDHQDPAEWMTVADYEQVQQAPDYRADLDLFVTGPDGEYLSCCIVWYDGRNRLGIFEPVCTHAGYRRRGFGRAVMVEGIRRVAALGAERVQVGSGQPFYEALGFQRVYTSFWWKKEL